MGCKYKFHDQDAYYFITLTTIGWIDVFTRNEYRDIVMDSLEYCQKYKGINIHAYVLMTNHLHMIISRKGDEKLSDLIRDIKKFTSLKLIKAISEHPQESRKNWMIYLFRQAGKNNSNNTQYQFWQQGNHPIELNPHLNLLEQKLEYIHNNPVEAGFVSDPTDWLYSSARNYSGLPPAIQCNLLQKGTSHPASRLFARRLTPVHSILQFIIWSQVGLPAYFLPEDLRQCIVYCDLL